MTRWGGGKEKAETVRRVCWCLVSKKLLLGKGMGSLHESKPFDFLVPLQVKPMKNDVLTSSSLIKHK